MRRNENKGAVWEAPTGDPKVCGSQSLFPVKLALVAARSASHILN